MPKWSPLINHLSHASYHIVLFRGHEVYLRDDGVLREYKKSLGHMINLNKSFFYLHDNTPLIVSIRLKRIMGIKQGYFPFIYLGCPVFYDRKKMSHFDELLNCAKENYDVAI